MDFANRNRNIRDAAKSERRHNRIEAVIIEGQLFAADHSLIHIEMRLPNSLFQSPTDSGIRINSGEVSYIPWIMSEIQSCAHTDF